MDTRELQLFLHVADTLSFSRAAERVHVSLSAVSRTIQRLEESVGRRLLERDRRSVRLTDAGRQFERYARETVESWQVLQRELDPDQGALHGALSVYCSVTASYSVLSPILERFRSDQPGIDILLHTGDQADAVDRINRGEEDVAIAARPDRLPGRVTCLTLLHSPLVFIAPAFDCAISQQLAHESDDFSSLPFILAERGVSRQRVDAWFRGAAKRPRIYAQVAGHEAIAAMVALGLGIGAVPQLVLENLSFRDQLRQLSTQLPLGPFPVGLCADRQRLENPLVAAFWDSAQRSYPAAKC